MKQALLIMPPGALIAGPAGPAGADGAAGAAGADGPAGADGAAGAAGADGADGADGRDGGMLTVPFAAVLHPAFTAGAGKGYCVWLVNTAGAYTFEGNWVYASASQDVMQYLVAGDDGTDLFLLPLGESDYGTFAAVVPQPFKVPAACVLSGTPAGGGYLGVVSATGAFGYQASPTTPGFTGALYLKVLAVAGGFLTCVAGGKISYGG